MNKILKDMLERAEYRTREWNDDIKEKSKRQFGEIFLGGEIFETAWYIAYNDRDLAKALLQEMASILADIQEETYEKLGEKLIENLKEYHEELFEDDEEEIKE